ncbi:hypothetical protein HYH03_014809 [Edaphochlamys debaryana]|uniref:Glyoxysomal processing protease, glyoxysomal n=1 Tax=Edaphochlamys debaryana TaxID=47281 RepID=A0A836BRV4_9CHLO|nr:hypothetical protein HYH03_014809 [Edaphochlamys debaryana]|eukprot:KAG2486507.1 hypothetical protein HYH03_014809 [Edaphochlamys debaryana]
MFQPVLVLVSGDEDTGAALERACAFATKTRAADTGVGLAFTSVSGLSLGSRLVLFPGSALRSQLVPGQRWPNSDSSEDAAPPRIVPGAALCAVSETGAAVLTPIATVRVASAALVAKHLLQSLNQDTTADPGSGAWSFKWAIGGHPCSPAEQGALVLCWAEPIASTPDGPVAATGGAASGSVFADPRRTAALRTLLSELRAGCCSGGCRDCGGACAAPAAVPGQLCQLRGSPFGCLAPYHFLNSHVNGAISAAFAAPPGAPVAAGSCAKRNPAAPPLPVMYSIDAHVFPGMEGALVAPLGPMPAPPGVKGPSRGASEPRPLGLLVSPLARRSDGVQVPLALSWGPVEAGVIRALSDLLRSAGVGGAGEEAEAASQQLQLQPVASPERPWRRVPQPPPPSGSGLAQRPSWLAALGQRMGSAGSWLWPRPSPELSLVPCASLGRDIRCSSAAAAAAGAAYAASLSDDGDDSISSGWPAAAARQHAGGGMGWGLGGGALPPQALQSVVLLRCRGSWATGVLVESESGLLVTTAHLFHSRSGAGANASSTSSAGAGPGTKGGGSGAGGSESWSQVVCWARVPWAEAAGVRGGAASARARQHEHIWLRARVVYVWGNHLDLAVLQLEPPYRNQWSSGSASAPSAALAQAAVQRVAHARPGDTRRGSGRSGPPLGLFEPVPQPQDGRHRYGGYDEDEDSLSTTSTYGGSSDEPSYGSGTPVWAVGHSLIGPAAEWPPLVSHGNVCKVLRRRSGQPTMIIATTTTHAGGSGGALLDGSGRLVGLVTSNARHAGGTTLPNMAFCIAAEELEPVIRWAAQERARTGLALGGSGGRFVEAEPPRGLAGGRRDRSPLRGGSERERERVRAAQRSLAALAATDEEDEDAARIWRLQVPSSGQGTGFGAAAAAALVAAVAAAALLPRRSRL